MAKCGDAPKLGEPESDIVVSDNGTGVSTFFYRRFVLFRNSLLEKKKKKT